MALASGLSQAALLAAAGACVALACSSDTIDLLPERESERAGAGSGGASAGRDSTGGQGGSDVGGSTAQAGTSGGTSGGAAGSSSCAGAACGGSSSDAGGMDNSGGSVNGCLFGGCQSCFNDNQCPDWLHCSESFGNVCVECDDEFGCRAGERCNLSIGRCAPMCEHDGDCFERVCDPILKACVPCSGDQQCLSDQNENTRRCVFGYCFECTESTDCPKGPRQICANWRCVECASDEDCGFDQRCDAGDCE